MKYVGIPFTSSPRHNTIKNEHALFTKSGKHTLLTHRSGHNSCYFSTFVPTGNIYI
jgi:hypothetical protein